MKANIKVDITVNGVIKFVEDTNRNIVAGENKHYTTNRTVDLSGINVTINCHEEMEDISPKDYIMAIGGACKEALSGLVANKVHSCNCKNEKE